MSEENQPDIKEDIFEAIRILEPNNALLNLKSSIGGRVSNPGEFQVIGLNDGKWCAIPKIHMIMTHYRGESAKFDRCLPSIYRGNPSKDDILINKLKILDFETVCREFPSVISSERDGLAINYEAIAQHYGLQTSIVDITTDIGVAAFFATHNYIEEDNSYQPIGDGIGTIRVFNCLELTPFIQNYEGPEYQLIGVQPFYRTAMQLAHGCKCSQGYDMSSSGLTILFKQNEDMSIRIGKIFTKDAGNVLFPREIISDAAKRVKESTSITKASIEKYCQENDCNIMEITTILKSHGYSVTSDPPFKLSRQQRRFLERKTQKDPYGGITITSRLQVLSPETITP